MSHARRGSIPAPEATSHVHSVVGVVTTLIVFIILTAGVAGSAFAHSDEPHQEPPPAAADASVPQATAPRATVAPEGDDHGHADGAPAHMEPESAGHANGREAQEATEHDHAAHGSWAETGFERFLAWLGKFHPLVVHFPIALILSAALAEIIFMRNRREIFRAAARFCLWVGAIGALGAAILGWFYAGFSLGEDDTLLSAHRWNGTFIAILALLALSVGEHDWRSGGRAGVFRLLLFAAAVLVAANGYLGGAMVYGPDHLSYPEPASGHAETESHD